MSVVLEHGGEPGPDMSAVELAQVESLLVKIKSTERKIHEENVTRQDAQQVEAGQDIDEVFMMMFGERGQAVSTTEQQERRRQFSDMSDQPEAEKAPPLPSHQVSGNMEVEDRTTALQQPTFVDEAKLEASSVVVQESADIDFNELFEEPSKAPDSEKATQEPPSNPSRTKQTCILS